MARTRAANPATVADAIAQLQEMNDGARSELAAGRRRSAGTLAIAGAVRAVDLICDAALGEHSVEPSHAVCGKRAGFDIREGKDHRPELHCRHAPLALGDSPRSLLSANLLANQLANQLANHQGMRGPF